ncbi:MAG TPA: enoyl-CoA hydratase/isomerase family protein [Sphingomonadales bacterium]
MNLSFKRTSDVEVTRDGNMLRVTIRRAEKRNPLSLGVLEEIRAAFSEHAGDESIVLAVVTGEGDQAFASGGDLRELADYRSEADGLALSRHGKAALDSVRNFPVPVVARINGVALGGGAELALACDMRIAARHARIGFVHSRLKIAPSWGGGIDLVRLVGPSRATWLMARGDVLDATEALRLGLIDSHAPDEDFDAFFEDCIESLRSQPPQVMRAIKSLVVTQRAMGRAAADAAETAHFARVWAHADHWAAVHSLESQRP